MPVAQIQNGAFYIELCYYRTLIGNPILEVKLTGQSGRMAIGSGRNGNEPLPSRFRSIR